MKNAKVAGDVHEEGCKKGQGRAFGSVAVLPRTPGLKQ